MANKNLGWTDEVFNQLAAADKRSGFPAGTMASLMQQEIGGQNQYLEDPTAYHYPLNAQGKRVASHTGKVSTAFGPFGILESTGRDPGYGVAPLKDKTFPEQLRFSADYLAARSKQAGGLQQGLSGYGEGAAYGKKVAGRIPGAGVLGSDPTMPAGFVEHTLVQQNVPTSIQQEVPTQVAVAPVAEQAAPWNQLQQVAVAPSMVNDMEGYGAAPLPMATPLPVQRRQPVLAALGKFGATAAASSGSHIGWKTVT